MAVDVKSGIIVPAEEVKKASGLGLPVAVIGACLDAETPVFTCDGAPLAAHLVDLSAVGILAFEGAAALASGIEEWRRTSLGTTEPLPVFDMTRRGELPAAWLAQCLVRQQDDTLRRTAQLTRDLSVLRRAHEETQANYVALEAFLNATGGAERRIALQIAPDPSLGRLLLAPGQEVSQRLPGASTGLCDIELFCPRSPSSGVLTAELSLLASGSTVARWSVPAPQIGPVLRLARLRALGPMAQTAVLSLHWEGDDPLPLSLGMVHPDPRFAVGDTGTVLALTLWTYVAGGLAPMEGEAIAAQGTPPGGLCRIGAPQFAEARRISGDVAFDAGYGGLMVRPSTPHLAAACLPGAILPGARMISGGIKVEAQGGPQVEFAYAIAPAQSRRHGLPQFAPGAMGAWRRLPAGEWVQHHLPLAAPVTEVSDLFLLTRLAEGEQASDPVPACFYRMTVDSRPQPGPAAQEPAPGDSAPGRELLADV